MKKTLNFLCILMLSFCFIGNFAVKAEASDSIGLVIAAEGGVFADRAGGRAVLVLKDSIYISDVITTDGSGKVQILLNDDSAITIGPNSSFELKDFADDGANSKFNAHMGQGALRVITGRVTQSNPEGFKVTTPLATVGIRGTIWGGRIEPEHEIIYVENSPHTMNVNGMELSSSMQAILTQGMPSQTTEFSAKEKITAITYSQILLPAGQVLTGDSSTGTLDSTGGSLSDAGSNLSDTLQNQSIEQLQGNMPSATTGLITGTLGTNGVFSFNVALANGSITNAATSGSTIQTAGTFKWDVSGGTGAFSGGTFSIDGFSGTAENPGGFTDGVSVGNATLSGTGSYGAVGDAVNADLYIHSDSIYIIINASGSGSRVK